MSEEQQQIIELPLSQQYCRSWTEVDALREIIANAVDSGSRVDVRWENGPSGGEAIVTNSQGEMVRSNLVLGGTTKADDEETIGTFGEGLKIGAMVLLREGKHTFVRSGKLQMEFFQGYSDALECSIVKIGIKEIPFRNGTDVRIYGVDEETLRKAKDLFLQLGDVNPMYYNEKGAIYETEKITGTLHLQGVEVYDGNGDRGPLLFTWDLKELEINRDRSLVDFWAVRRQMGHVLDDCDDYDTIYTFLKAWMMTQDEAWDKDWVDVHLSFELEDNELKEIWRKAAKEVVGSRDITCINTGLASLSDFSSHNWASVEVHENARDLLKDLGYKTDLEVLVEGASGEFVLTDELSVEEQRLLDNARKMAEMAVGVDADQYEIRVFERTVREDQLDMENVMELLLIGGGIGTILGQWKSDNQIVYIRHSLLDERVYWRLVEVIAHELVHKVSSAGDNSRRFETAIFKVVVNLLKMGGTKGMYY